MKETVTVDKLERKFVKLNSISSCLRCSICMEVFFMPSRLFCGHTFCYECINNCIKSKPACPICRADIEPKNVGKDLLAYNIINELEVFCIYDECSWKGELELLEPHLNYECLLHTSSQTKRHQQKAETILKPTLDEEIEEKINENINKGSLISRAIKNDDSMRAGEKFDVARKMLQTESCNLDNSLIRKNIKKATKKEVEKEKEKDEIKEDKQALDHFLMDLFQ